MKKYLIFLGIIFIPLHTWAQNEEFQTIFKHKEGERIKISGFGGPIINFTAIDNDFALMMGGGCGIIIGNLFLGGYGAGKTNELPFKDKELITDNNEYVLGYGHGGLWFGYIIRPKNAIHLSLSSQIGWGAVSKKLKVPEDEDFENMESHAITVLTPIVEIEYNVSRFFKIGTGATWSYVTGNNLTNTGYSSNSFSKPSFFLSFKVGWFD